MDRENQRRNYLLGLAAEGRFDELQEIYETEVGRPRDTSAISLIEEILDKEFPKELGLAVDAQPLDS